MANIGTLAVLMTGGIAGFEASMRKSQDVMEGTLSTAEHFAHGMEGALAAIGVEEIGSKILEAGREFGEFIYHAMEGVEAQKKLADRTGISTEALGVFQHAARMAGVGTETLTNGIGHMLKNIGEFAVKGGDGEATLNRIGLSAVNLANESPEKAFQDIANAMEAIQIPAERAQAAVTIFGKSGQELLPLLMEGASGIAAAQKEAEEFHLTLSEVDSNKVVAANEEIKRIGEIGEGIGNLIAVKVAPIITDVAERFIAWATEGDRMGKIVSDAFDLAAKSVGFLTNQVYLGEAAVSGIRIFYLEASASILDGIDAIGGGLVKLLNLLPGVNLAWTNTFSSMAEAMRQVAGEESDKLDESMKKWTEGEGYRQVDGYLQSVAAKADESAQKIADAAGGKGISDIDGALEKLGKVDKVIEHLQEQYDNLGKTEAERGLSAAEKAGATPEALAQIQAIIDATKTLKGELDAAQDLDQLHKKVDQLDMSKGEKAVDDIKRKGGSDDQIAEAQKLQEILDGWEESHKRINKLQEDAKKTIEETRTPMEKLNARVDELGQELDANLITQEEYDRAVEKAKEKEFGHPKAPNLLEAGSQASLKMIHDIETHTQQATKSRGHRGGHKEQVEIAKRQLAALEQIASQRGQEIAVLSI